MHSVFLFGRSSGPSAISLQKPKNAFVKDAAAVPNAKESKVQSRQVQSLKF